MFSRERHDMVMTSYGVDESRGTCGRADQFFANLAFAVVVVAWVSGCCVILGHAQATCTVKEPEEHSTKQTEPTEIKSEMARAFAGGR